MKILAQVATANTLFKASASWSWTQLAPGLWGRCLFKLRFFDETKTPFATHTRPKRWKVPFPAAHLQGAFASGRRPGIRPSFVFLLVRFGNIAHHGLILSKKLNVLVPAGTCQKQIIGHSHLTHPGFVFQHAPDSRAYVQELCDKSIDVSCTENLGDGGWMGKETKRILSRLGPFFSKAQACPK